MQSRICVGDGEPCPEQCRMAEASGRLSAGTPDGRFRLALGGGDMQMIRQKIPLYLSENMLAVVVQKFPGWRGEFIGHADWLTLKLTKILFE